jgi:hypothetical protein
LWFGLVWFCFGLFCLVLFWFFLVFFGFVLGVVSVGGSLVVVFAAGFRSSSSSCSCGSVLSVSVAGFHFGGCSGEVGGVDGLCKRRVHLV